MFQVNVMRETEGKEREKLHRDVQNEMKWMESQVDEKRQGRKVHFLYRHVSYMRTYCIYAWTYMETKSWRREKKRREKERERERMRKKE